METGIGQATAGASTSEANCQIRKFFIFNEKFGNDSDNEMGKVVYFHPSQTDEDTQLKQVGLSEAIIQFATKFNTKLPCESLHTQKSRYVYSSPEPGYWIVMVLSIPSIKRLSPEGVEFIEYLGDEVQDDVFQAILQKLYKKFVLLNDTLENIYENYGLEELQSRLKRFFDTTIAKMDPSQCGVSEVFTGLQFFPLERSMFLRIQCFINKLLLTWPTIKYVLLMQGDRLIWSGIEQNNIQIFYDYLVNDLLSKYFRTGANKQSAFGIICHQKSHITMLQDESPVNQSHYLNTIFGTHSTAMNTSVISTANSTSNDTDSFTTACESAVDGKPKKDDKYARFHMIIYKAEQTYVTLLIPEKEDFSRETASNIELFLNVNFTSMARQLVKLPSLLSPSPQMASCNSSHSIPGLSDGSPPNVKFIYFNSLNLAEKASPGVRCELDAYKLLADLRADLSRTTDNSEITLKSVSETWVVAKTANGREFYAIFNQPGANVLDIDEELRKLTDAQLTNIFFQD